MVQVVVDHPSFAGLVGLFQDVVHQVIAVVVEPTIGGDTRQGQEHLTPGTHVVLLWLRVADEELKVGVDPLSFSRDGRSQSHDQGVDQVLSPYTEGPMHVELAQGEKQLTPRAHGRLCS